MNGVSFDAWLDEIRLLTAGQRQAGFACLALAAADDDWDPIPIGAADGHLGETGRLTETAAAVLPADWLRSAVGVGWHQ